MWHDDDDGRPETQTVRLGANHVAQARIRIKIQGIIKYCSLIMAASYPCIKAML